MPILAIKILLEDPDVQYFLKKHTDPDFVDIYTHWVEGYFIGAETAIQLTHKHEDRLFLRFAVLKDVVKATYKVTREGDLGEFLINPFLVRKTLLSI